jgi:hypothetical protein
MYEKQIKKSCTAVGTAFRYEYVDSKGSPTLAFFKRIALCVGGIPGFPKMGLEELPGAIACRLDVPLPSNSLDVGGADNRVWFEAVTPVLASAFLRPDNSAINEFLPVFPDPNGKEGREHLALHKKVERNSRIVRQLKALSTDKDVLGFVFCKYCRIAPGAKFGVEIIEAHHVVPVSEAGVRTVTLKDFILLCPNCHSAIHAGARVKRPITIGGRT